MSRIGRSPIPVPSGVTVALVDDSVTVTGPQGALARPLPPGITIRQDGDVLVVDRPDDQRQNRALHGLTRSLVANMVAGVTEGFYQGARDRRRRLPGHGQGPGRPRAGSRVLAPGAGDSSRRRHLRGAHPHPDHRQGHRQGAGRPGGRRHPQAPQARALQGQGRPLRRRAGRAQGRKGSQVMARTDHKRALRMPPARPGPRPGRRHGRPSPPGGVPLQQAHLRPAHRRRGRSHAGRRVVGRGRAARATGPGRWG